MRGPPFYKGTTVDPPWPERGGGRIRRGAQAHYPLVPLAEIPNVIMSSPLWRPDPQGSFVWLWCPSWRAACGQAALVLRALGARPVRKWTWVKGKVKPSKALERALADGLDAAAFASVLDVLTKHDAGVLSLQPGIGQYGRGSHEDLVLGVIGKLRPLPAIRSIVDTLVADCPRRAGKRIHSAKPDEMYERVRAGTPGPLAALFERIPRVGFDTWGKLDGEAPPPATVFWDGAHHVREGA